MLEKNLKIDINSLALLLILIAEICLYTSNTIVLYFIITFLGMLCSLVANFKRVRFKFNKFIFWLICIYGMFFFYGIFNLKKGVFPWSSLIYRLIEGIFIYISTKSLVQKDNKKIFNVYILSGLISLSMLLIKEGSNILQGGTRIGDSLSGNVNTVGYNFGIIITVIMWSYIHEKRIWKLLMFAIFTVAMLLTGSKKTIIILILNLIMYCFLEKKHISKWLKIVIIILTLYYLVFNISYMYNIIGVRIENMFETLLGSNTDGNYSYSTEIREKMIEEGINLFLKKPIFGGGWNYYWANTVYEYEYSHNNYIEILCSFGIIGFFVYYYKHISNFICIIKNVKLKEYVNKEKNIIALIFLIMSLALDYAAVTFSAQVIWYIPIITSSILLENIDEERKENE